MEKVLLIPINSLKMLPVEAFDTGSAIKSIFLKLFKLVSCNMDLFDSEKACEKLFKLIEIGLFTESGFMIFNHCSVETISSLIKSCKHIKYLVIGFFKYLKKYNNGQKSINQLGEIASILASKINRNENDRYLFGLIKEVVGNSKIQDEILINFVFALNVNECIVLESLSAKGKFKTMCLKKCRIRSKPEANVTFI